MRSNLQDSNQSASIHSLIDTSDKFTHLKNLFFLGQILHGIGSAPLWTVGVTYLDDNLPSSTSPLYVGVFYAFAVIGPAIGFLGGGQLLQVRFILPQIKTLHFTFAIITSTVSYTQ